MSFDYEQPNHQLNKSTLKDRLNEPDAFDKVMRFRSKDQLEIVINNLSDNESERMIFCFKYKKGKWEPVEYDTFETMNRYDELAFGNFRNLEKSD
ncbi:MAG: hypothetical protein EAY75_14020 [Bacteroidetes bacterium]|nr:MAG: hypothetical protein EAY75_14020 [Bacteroidota bacterium]